MFRTFGGFLPPEALTIITDQIVKISNSEDGGLLSLGMLLAVSSSSAAMTAIIDTLNRAYGIEDRRPWWRVRLTAIALTVGVAIFILHLVRARSHRADARQRSWRRPGGSGRPLSGRWKILQWPVIFMMVSLSIAFIYRFAPDVKQEWIWLTPGSVLATTLWLVASLGFKYYVANWGHYTETYGLLGAVMILLLWFYISGSGDPIGAEMNVEIEHAGVAGPAVASATGRSPVLSGGNPRSRLLSRRILGCQLSSYAHSPLLLSLVLAAPASAQVDVSSLQEAAVGWLRAGHPRRYVNPPGNEIAGARFLAGNPRRGRHSLRDRRVGSGPRQHLGAAQGR